MPHRSYLIVLLAAAAVAHAQEPGAIMAPPPDSAHPATAPVLFICRGAGALKVDGVTTATQSPHENVHTLELTGLTPGLHTLEFGGQTLRFSVGPTAENFTAFKTHPPAAQCETCHAVRLGRWRFQRVSLASVCSQCHARETFQAKHTHEMQVLTDCQLCHNPHGSTAAQPAHLKLTPKAACNQCHALP